MTSQIERKILIAFAAALILLIALYTFTFANMRFLRDSNLQVAHRYQTIGVLDNIQLIVTDAEDGQRGYLITGEEAYLEPHGTAEAAVEGQIARLGDLFQNDTDLQQSLPTLVELVRQRFDIIDRTVELRRTAGAEAAADFLRGGEGHRVTTQIRTLVAQMKSAEAAVLERVSQEAESRSRIATGALLLVSLLIVGLLALVYRLVRRDLAERRRVQQTLQSFSVQLERSNRELQDFASVASHDLQEPLRKIQAFGDRLQDKYAAGLGEEGRDYVDRMQKAAARMQTLINDLLSYSRVTTKAQPFSLVSLDKVAQEVLKDMEAQIERTAGQVEVGELPTVEADALQMRQLLQNLIGNALKYHRSSTPPVVRISSAPAGEDPRPAGVAVDPALWSLQVRDNGIGFDEKYLDRIFVPFQRLHGRNEYEGTGIGLAICRKIVERHGGTITATSSPGQGATFTFTLPARQAEL